MFRQRRLVPEVMDQPGLVVARHRAALRGLARINALSGIAHVFWPALRDLAQECAPRHVRVLDVATGGGDVPLNLWRKARRTGTSLILEACDVSPVAIDFARAAAESQAANVRFFVHNAVGCPLPERYDAVICSLFLHHLTDDQACDLLRRMADAAGRLVLVNDLSRGRLGWLLAWAGCRILTRCDVVHTD